MKAGSARQALREGTAIEHGRVDSLYASLDLGDPRQYRLLLRGLSAAFLPIEAFLDARAGNLLADWPIRRRGHLLLADLQALGSTPASPFPPSSLDDDASLWGAVYVLEGSRLGGEVLRRSLYEGAPSRFLGARQPPGGWRKVLDRLDESLYSMALVEQAVTAAKSVFESFEDGARRELGVS